MAKTKHEKLSIAWLWSCFFVKTLKVSYYACLKEVGYL